MLNNKLVALRLVELTAITCCCCCLQRQTLLAHNKQDDDDDHDHHRNNKDRNYIYGRRYNWPLDVRHSAIAACLFGRNRMEANIIAVVPDNLTHNLARAHIQ